MSNIKLSIYQNLPSGGAFNLYEQLAVFFKKRYIVFEYSEYLIINKFNTFIHYLFVVLVLSLKNAIKISKQINKTDVLIVFHSWLMKSPFILRFSKIPTIYICHEPPREFYDYEYIKTFTIKEKIVNTIRLPIKILDYLNVKNCKLLTIVANSNFSANNIYNSYGLNAEVVYPGIKINNKLKINSYESRENIVICVGAINKLKNQLFILSAVSKIPKLKRPRIIFVGNGKDDSYEKKLIEFAKINEIQLEIYLNIDEYKLISLYQISKVFCYAPIGEPFGLVILEAMSLGLPLITYKYGGGYSEIISNKNGIMLDNLNMEIWAVAISKMLENKAKWGEYSSNNKNESKKYSINKMNRKILQLIEKNCI